MKLFANPVLIGLDSECLKFRHSFELRGFLPFIPSIDLSRRWDNCKIIENDHFV
jgi:hypothetical protein